MHQADPGFSGESIPTAVSFRAISLPMLRMDVSAVMPSLPGPHKRMYKSG